LRVVLGTLLSASWCMRALVTPVLAALGTAGAFAASKSAQDIVLNSVAIAFVFELDDFMYLAVVSRKRREAFEGAPFPPTSPLNSKLTRSVVSLVAWVIFLIDAYFAIAFYSTVTSPGRPDGNVEFISFYVQKYTNVRWWIIARFGVIGLTQLFLILYPNHLQGSMGKARLAFTGMAFVVALLIILYFAFFFNAWMDFSFGSMESPWNLVNCWGFGEHPTYEQYLHSIGVSVDWRTNAKGTNSSSLLNDTETAHGRRLATRSRSSAGEASSSVDAGYPSPPSTGTFWPTSASAAGHLDCTLWHLSEAFRSDIVNNGEAISMRCHMHQYIWRLFSDEPPWGGGWAANDVCPHFDQVSNARNTYRAIAGTSH